tara:strand:+ start:477 stop:740 length:264 start_codon:yes stop_codon:yes gene_type:complete
MDKDPILKNTTCFTEHKRFKLACEKCSCRCWIESKQNLNCAVIAAENGPWILQDIGDIFGVTRMRICQIEKDILEKLAKFNLKSSPE